MKKVEKDKTAILSEDELDKVSGGKFDERGGVASIPGLKCPHCGKFIPKTITELLTQGHLRCPYCLSKLPLITQQKQQKP